MMRVSKFDAWGNDFLVLDVAQLRSVGIDEAAVNWPDVSRAWCNRASGVGADGLLLLERIDDGFDVVCGWRKHRQDRAVTRLLPSRFANLLIARVTGARIHDTGCSLKAYRSCLSFSAA